MCVCGQSCVDRPVRCRTMPICPVCEKNVSVFHWDIFAGSCTACTGIDTDSLEEILSQECGQCNGRNIFARASRLRDGLPLPDHERQVKCLSNCFIHDTSVHHIDCGGESRNFLARRKQAVVGDPQHIRERDIAERVSACSAHSPPHIGDAIVQDAVHNAGGTGMSCGARCFQTTAWIDANINDDCPGLHQLQVIGHNLRLQI